MLLVTSHVILNAHFASEVLTIAEDVRPVTTSTTMQKPALHALQAQDLLLIWLQSLRQATVVCATPAVGHALAPERTASVVQLANA